MLKPDFEKLDAAVNWLNYSTRILVDEKPADLVKNELAGVIARQAGWTPYNDHTNMPGAVIKDGQRSFVEFVAFKEILGYSPWNKFYHAEADVEVFKKVLAETDFPKLQDLIIEWKNQTLVEKANQKVDDECDFQ